MIVTSLVFIATCSLGQMAEVHTTVYEVDPVSDTAMTLGLAATLGAAGYIMNTGPFEARCQATGKAACAPANLSAIDRYSLGRQSKLWLHISDIGEISGLLLPSLLVGIDIALSDSTAPWSDFGSEAMVMMQASLAAGLVSTVLKTAISRPRPRQYDPKTYRGVNASQTSFPSGHSALVSSGAAAYAMTYWNRHPNSPWRFAVVGGAAAISGLTAFGRVQGGAHFTSDVLAGLTIGTACGLLVPWLHLRQAPVSFSVDTRPAEAGFRFQISGEF